MESRERAEEAAARWIAQRETDPWDEQTAAEFQFWLAASVSHRAAYYRLNAIWHEAGRLKALNAYAARGQSVSAMPEEEQQHDEEEQGHPYPLFQTEEGVPQAGEASSASRRRIWSVPVAASLLLAVGATLFVSRDAIFNPNRYSTVVGGLAAVPMSDGSRVTLNTDSRLRLSLSEQERRIDLERGEAFFEVAKDPSRPFVVIAGDQRVIAVGTQFSVRRDGDDVRVVVTEGTVRMEPAGEKEPVRGSAQDELIPEEAAVRASTRIGSGEVLLLPAGSIARSERDAILVQKKPLAEIEQSLTWRSGLLTFRDTPLADAVAEFNRYNTRKIVIEDPAIAAFEVGGIFRSTNLDPFVHLIEEAFPIRTRQEENRIVLTSR